jgi:hypothetical protein
MSERPIPYIWHLIGTMPSTNTRIANSILMAMGTFLIMAVTALIVSIRGQGQGWEPSEIWLGFLILWAGLDLGQFMGKRITSAEHVAAKQGILPPEEPPTKQPEIGA